jgi:hypothetical protein
MQNHSEPFPHRTGTKFTAAQYAELLRNLPGDDEYRVYPSYPNRFIFKADKGFWKDVFNDISPGGNVRFQLNRDHPGYSLGPHTDGEDKELTCIFYLAEVEVPEAGTSLFVPKGKTRKDTHHGFDEFDLVKTVPYAPNTYLSFKRTDRSFHGVFPCAITRNTIQMTKYRG